MADFEGNTLPARVLPRPLLCRDAVLTRRLPTDGLPVSAEPEEVGADGNAPAQVVDSLRNARACLVCKLVKSQNQFVDHGCDNCNFLEMEQNQERMMDCTTAHFDGLAAFVAPRESWAAKWQRCNSYCPGVYCIKMTGELPDFVKDFMKDNNIQSLSDQ